MGYKFVEDEKTAEKVLAPDQNFELLQKAFHLVLMKRPVLEVLNTLNNDWGFRTPKTSHTGGKELSLSGLYRVLHNEFYCGYIYTPDSERIQGKHQPMITEAQFWQIQEHLGIRANQNRNGSISPTVG